MRNINALTNNISYGELLVLNKLVPHLWKAINKKEKKVIVNLTALAKEARQPSCIGNNAIKALTISEIITYRAKPKMGTVITILSPTGVTQLKEYFESGELNV